MGKEELAELEAKSWVKGLDNQVVLMAKKVIMREIIRKGRSQIAEEYLKKCLLTFSSNFELMGELLTAYAKLIKKDY